MLPNSKLWRKKVQTICLQIDPPTLTNTNASCLIISIVFLTQYHVSIVYPQVMAMAISILTSNEDTTTPSTVQEQFALTTNVEVGTLMTIIDSLATLFWEFSKCPPRVINMGQEILLQTGLSADIVVAFMSTFRENETTIAQLKRSLSVNQDSFHDLAWRLDVEVARRNMHVMATPVYMLRLDLTPSRDHHHHISNTSTANETTADNPPAVSSSLISLHLQADYANMKQMQTELQRAVDALQSAHCQRLSRYIS